MIGRRIAIAGTVQGVGFRPWVYRVARELGLRGQVRNDAGGVIIDAHGGVDALDQLLVRLRADAPGQVRDLRWTALDAPPPPDFTIDTSRAAGAVAVSIPPDLATCPACLRELRDPTDRRYRYPFTNCTHCGPRFTIAFALPYDRPATTMAGFPLCPACAREYRDPADRRFHAQPIACPVCGPQLRLEPGAAREPGSPGPGRVPGVTDAPTAPPVDEPPVGPTGDRRRDDDPLTAAAASLRAGAIIAVKGLGGYHLACDATAPTAVAALRARKHREHKPFAVMVADLTAAAALAVLTDADRAALSDPARPIVLVPRRDADGARAAVSAAEPAHAAAARPLAPAVAPDTPLVGLFLPYTPLHHLLLDAVGRPLVMTSGNLSDEPIATDDADARARLAPLADALLAHDRPIAMRCDDSVVRVIAGAPMILRRSRGFVPRAVPLTHRIDRPILAVGAHLKNACCLAHGDAAYLGPHIGDLDGALAVEFMAEAIARLERLVQVRPEVIAHDLHPDFASTHYARERASAEGIEAIAIAHHHAHVAAGIAEHGLRGPVLGLAWDGVGLGPDGAAWGGELLRVDGDRAERLATLRPIALAGGDAAVAQVWRVALALVDDAFDGAPPALPLFERLPARDRTVVREMIARDLNAPRVHGMGRLFDGIGALALGRSHARHEAEVAIALEHAAGDAAPHVPPYPLPIDRAGPLPLIDHRPLVRAVVADVRAGVAATIIAARFHAALVTIASSLVADARAVHGPLPLVLGGGCFQNARLTEGVVRAIVDVHVPRSVPPGDGGLALGQVLIAAARGRVLACA